MSRIASRSLAAITACRLAAIVSACTATNTPTGSATAGSAIPDGIYRNEVSIDDLLAAGAAISSS